MSLPLKTTNLLRVCLGRLSPMTSNLHSTAVRREIFKIQDEADFKAKVLENKNLVILDFFATWCGPCKLLTPRLESVIGSKTGSGVDLAKVDVDELDIVAGQYNVSSIPSVFAIKNGKIVDQFVGLKDDDQLQTFVESALKK